MGLTISDKAIDFKLIGTDSKEYTLDDFSDKELLVVIFTCNHCPYAIAYENRIKDIQSDYQNKNVQVIAINSNDSESHPGDSFDSMITRSNEKQFNFPYLRDETQEIALKYGPEVTPDVFLFDKNRNLQYRGRIDDNWDNKKKSSSNDVRTNIDLLLGNKEIKNSTQKAVGCSIKWKKSHYT